MKPYPEYRPTGLAWLPQVPSGWKVEWLGHLCKIKSHVGFADEPLLSVYLFRGVIPFTDVAEKRTNVTSETLDKYQLVEPGDFVLNNQQAWRGSVGVSALRGIVSPAYFVLSVSNELDSAFANYLFRDKYMVNCYERCSKGIGSIQRNLDWSKAKYISVPLPPLPEQREIVAYLDSATAKIDAAVKAIEKSIGLLKERRVRLVSDAVTGRGRVSEK